MAVNCKCKKHSAEHSNMKSSVGITVRRNKKQIRVKKNSIPNISITTNRYHNSEQRLRKDRWVHHCFSSDFRMKQEDKPAQKNVVDGTESLASRIKSVMKSQSQLHIYKSSSLVGNKYHGKDLSIANLLQVLKKNKKMILENTDLLVTCWIWTRNENFHLGDNEHRIVCFRCD